MAQEVVAEEVVTEETAGGVHTDDIDDETDEKKHATLETYIDETNDTAFTDTRTFNLVTDEHDMEDVSLDETSEQIHEPTVTSTRTIPQLTIDTNTESKTHRQTTFSRAESVLLSTKTFIRQHSIFVNSVTWQHVLKMASKRARLIIYGLFIIAISSILVRLKNDGNNEAALGLDILNRIHQGVIAFTAWYYYKPDRFTKKQLIIMASVFTFFYFSFHVINFALDPNNYVINREYNSNATSSLFWRCQLTFIVICLQILLPWVYRKHPLPQNRNNNYKLPYILLAVVQLISYVVWFVWLGNAALVSGAFAIQIFLSAAAVWWQNKRIDSKTDTVELNHGWMCFLSLGSQALGIGIGSALISLIARGESDAAKCISWFIWAMVVSGMLRMFAKMAEWSLPEKTQPVFMFSIQFADDFYSELVLALVEPFSQVFFILVALTICRDVFRDIGGFDWIIRRAFGCSKTAKDENLKSEYEMAKKFSVISEVNLFCEILSLMIIVFWACLILCLEHIGILNQTMTPWQHGKLILAYLGLMCMTFPQDRIVRKMREKNLLRLEKHIRDFQKKHPDQALDVKFIDKEDYLTQGLVPWQHAGPFLTVQIGFVVFYGIARLYSAV